MVGVGAMKHIFAKLLYAHDFKRKEAVSFASFLALNTLFVKVAFGKQKIEVSGKYWKPLIPAVFLWGGVFLSYFALIYLSASILSVFHTGTSLFTIALLYVVLGRRTLTKWHWIGMAVATV